MGRTKGAKNHEKIISENEGFLDFSGSLSDSGRLSEDSVMKTYKDSPVTQSTNVPYKSNTEAEIVMGDPQLGIANQDLSQEIAPDTDEDVGLNPDDAQKIVDSNGAESKLVPNQDNLVQSVKNRDSFIEIFHHWKRERQSTIEKLEKLSADVHRDQKGFNSARYLCKNISFQSRTLKSREISQVTDFLASMSAVMCDTFDGLTSAAQAFNVDCYQSRFEEIMGQDANVTKSLYDARSLCVAEYKGVEEIIRSYHLNTFMETVEKISDVLEMDKFLMELKGTSIRAFPSLFSDFLNRSSKPQVMGEVFDFFQSYANDNPAALDALKSAGRATISVLDAWGAESVRPSSNNSTAVTACANTVFMIDDKQELEKLEVAMLENGPQAKLEARIRNAIDALSEEMEEVCSMVSNNFQSANDNPLAITKP